LVQGEGAAAQIARAIDLVNEWGKADCIIVGRGGGSFEDLQAFNEEITARSIANSKIPVISAVGHETDFTIADFAADKRAPTPSAAAELVSFDLAQTKAYVNSCLQKARRITAQRIENGKQRLESLKNRRVFKNPAEGIYDRQIYIHTLLKRAQTVLNARISENKARIKYCAGAAENLSPNKTLLRGYAIITGEEGKAVVNATDMPRNINIKMHDGEAKAQVTQTL
jgi:exodeoxyribonuclease VII large subunit